MTGLKHLAEDVALSVGNLGQQDVLKAQLHRLDGITKEVESLLTELGEVGGNYSVARAAGFAPDPPDVRPALTALKRTGDQLKKGETPDPAPISKSVSSAIQTARGALNEAWQAHVAARACPASTASTLS